MSNDEKQQIIHTEDDTYMKIWEAEQQYISTRWNTVTFFIGISFAILGFSFQSSLAPLEAFAIRTSGLILYWFSYTFYLHFYTYTNFLRSYLIEMEKAGHTKYNIQGQARKAVNVGLNKYMATRNMLLYMGIIYSLGIILLLLFHL